MDTSRFLLASCLTRLHDEDGEDVDDDRHCNPRAWQKVKGLRSWSMMTTITMIPMLLLLLLMMMMITLMVVEIVM